MDILKLADVVRQTGFEVHSYFKNGFPEKVYENALAHRLSKLGIAVIQQHPISVYDQDGTQVGQYFADLFVEGCLIVELKAVKAILDEHIAQLLGYLTATRIRDGMLINFGAQKYQVRKSVV